MFLYNICIAYSDEVASLSPRAACMGAGMLESEAGAGIFAPEPRSIADRPGRRAALHRHDRVAALDPPDDSRLRVASLPDAGAERWRGRRIAGDEQAAGGLRVGQQAAPPVRKPLGRHDGLG